MTSGALVQQILVTLGGLILTGSWVPQIYKTLKTKSSQDLSISFLTAAAAGTLLLVPYSFFISDTFFIFVNFFAGLFAAITLVVALVYRPTRRIKQSVRQAETVIG